MQTMYETAISKIETSKSETDRLAYADRAIAALKQLSPTEQDRIATQEFIRFKNFIAWRLEGK